MGYFPNLITVIVIVAISAGFIKLFKLIFEGIARQRIKLSGFYMERTAFVTRLRTAKNEEVSVPNAATMSSNVVNFSPRPGARDSRSKTA